MWNFLQTIPPFYNSLVVAGGSWRFPKAWKLISDLSKYGATSLQGKGHYIGEIFSWFFMLKFITFKLKTGRKFVNQQFFEGINLLCQFFNFSITSLTS